MEALIYSFRVHMPAFVHNIHYLTMLLYHPCYSQ